MPSLVSTVSELTSEYFLTSQGKMGFVLLRLADSQESFAQGSESIDRLRGLITEARARHPETRIGLTGLPVMENDEMRSSQTAMLKASLLSLFGVACLFVAGFGGLRHPLMTVAALLLAMGWSFGYITFSVGHLNILSVSFGVILIGLGIDFGVHYVARYLQLRGGIRSSDEALVETAGSVGPGIVTGAITTAIAFFTAGFTEFTGIAELGVIAGGGILLCCVAALLVLPAMVHLSDGHRVGQILPSPLDIHTWMRPLFARPLLLLAVTTVGTAAVSVGIKDLWYDHNLLNLQAEGLESVELERRLLAESDQSVWFALSIAESREELLTRKSQFLELPSVQGVKEIASLIPTESEEKLKIIAQIRSRLADLPERPPQIAPDPPERLGRELAKAQALLAGFSGSARTQRGLDQVRDILRRMSPGGCHKRLSAYQYDMAGDLLSRLHTLRAIASPEPPKLSDLPESLVTRFVGQGGRFLLQIYSNADIWDMEAMEQFVREVRSVDPRVTGNPLQTYEASRQMKRSYEQAAWYALAAILMILYLDFRSLRHTLLAMFPVGLGMLQLFGILGLLDVPLNPANMIVLPLILGIGIDDGVHVIHDFRRRNGPYRMSASTASAVLITSLTTMVGFGSLMIASHRGLQSLGRVLTIGVSCCLFTSLIMLPALLTWLTRNQSQGEGQESGYARSPSTTQKIYRSDSAQRPGASPQALPERRRPARDFPERQPGGSVGSRP
jgi:hopanoid biosynthesis associated RND transporter like protein HpnN